MLFEHSRGVHYWQRPTLRAAAEAAGRTPAAVRVVSALPVAVTNHIDSARAEATQRFAHYGSLPSYRAMLDREGYAEATDAALIGPEVEQLAGPTPTAALHGEQA